MKVFPLFFKCCLIINIEFITLLHLFIPESTCLEKKKEQSSNFLKELRENVHKKILNPMLKVSMKLILPTRLLLKIAL